MRFILPMPGNEDLARDIARLAGADLGGVETRRFPDDESYLRLACDPRGKHVDIVCTLARPDDQFLRLVFAADAARAQGALSVNLIAPYLAYMRQDRSFKPGEAVSSVSFAQLLSRSFDSLVTVDPHLHRHKDLSEIYSIPTRVAHAAPLLGDWIKSHVANPIVIGPDRESAQWAGAVAARAGAQHLVLHKTRLSDRAVQIALPDLSGIAGLTPVLVDDIASSGTTLIEAARLLSLAAMAKPYCLVVHALFADQAYERLAALCTKVVSTDTVTHASNEIGVAGILCSEREKA